MSCGQKRCDEDEDDWDDFKKDHEIQHMHNWRVYSNESRIAKRLVQKTPTLKGKLLQLDVMHVIAKDLLEQTHKTERANLIAAMEFIKNFDTQQWP